MSGTAKRIVFMGSPDFAVPSLDALVASTRYRPLLVVSQPDRPRGRGRVVSPTDVRARAIALDIPSITMEKATYADGVRDVVALQPDAIVVVAFGLILRRDLLDLPPFGCVNVHASLLPRHRGVSPIQAAILAGDAVTGCTTMRIDDGVDTGDILLQEQIPLDPAYTAGTLSRRLAELGAGLLIRTLDGVFDNAIAPAPQDSAQATHTKKIRKAHGAIDWTKTAAEVVAHVRAMTPWPSAYAFHRERRLIVLECEAVAGSTAHEPGHVVSVDPLIVACGVGSVSIRILRPEGRRAMSPAEYGAGHAIAPGDSFAGATR